MKVAVLLAVLGLAVSGEALKCYTCKSDKLKADSGSGITEELLDSVAEKCEDFDPSNPDKKFEKDCDAANKGCLKIVKNDKIQLLTCATEAKDECKEGNCICSKDLCNGTGRGWPSVALLLAALTTALVGGR